MAIALWETLFSQAWVVLTGGAFLVGYAVSLGSGPVMVGWLAALPFLAQVAQVAGAWLTERTGSRKGLTLIFVGAGRAAWLLLIPVAFLGPGRETRIAMVLVVGAASGLALAGAVPWLTWLGDLVPRKVRGRWVGCRQQIVGVVTVCCSLGGGWLLDTLTRARSAPFAFAAVFGAAGLAALLSLVLLAAQPVPVRSQAPRVGLREGFGAVFAPTGFRKVLAAFLLWNVAVGLSAPFFALYMFRNLRMSYTLVALQMALTAAASLAANPLWGRMVDRFGVRPVLLLNAGLVSAVPLYWLFPTPEWLWPVWFDAVFSGIVWTGFNLAAFSLPFAVTPPRGRAYFLAVLSLATGLGFGIASVLGGYLAKWLDAFRWQAPWGTVLLSFHVVFIVSSLLRLLAALRMRSLREPGSRATGAMIQLVGYGVLRRIAVGRQMFLAPRRGRPPGKIGRGHAQDGEPG
jgi:MFS family permease